MSAPAVGCVVHYHNRAGIGQIEKAKVLFVHDDGYINLELFDAHGKQHVLRRAHWHDAGGEPTIGEMQVREMDMTEAGWIARSTHPTGSKEWAEPIAP
jgi:hypothetical protein